jgi:alpha-N-arabinofuranosidase
MHSRTDCLITLLATSLLTTVVLAEPAPVHAVIDTTVVGAPISKNIYGQFLEHGGDIVNEGVWAEMLVDRKFYYPVTSNPPALPPVPEWRRRGPQRFWKTIGGDEFVSMDSSNPYSGEHTPAIKLDKQTPHGFEQKGLAVRKGKNYSGRIVLAGDAGSNVKVTLIWGSDPAQRQTLTVTGVQAAYKKYPLKFTSAADSDDATLEITATGSGTMHVGAVSLMPADNIQGFRKEIVSALKELDFGVLRFPGGNFVSSHEWRNAVGDIDKRPPIYDTVWKAVQPNDVGTDEFIELCKLLGVAPYITVNAGFGDAWSARELVEYANGAATTPMGKWRAENGHPQPYGVKYWGIGNEPWGDYQMGAMALEQYEVKHNDFAKAMRKVDPSIILIAGGAMPDVMAGADQSRRINGQIVPDYLSKADWSGNLLLHCLDNIDMLSEHYYSTSDMHLDLKTGKKVNIGPQSLIEWERAPATQVRVKYEHYQEYLKRIPALKNKPVPIAIDEWAYIDRDMRGTYKTVPALAWAMHEMFRHSDLYQMGAFTFATAMVNESRTDAVLSPTGLLFKMYSNHFGSLPVAVSGDSPQPKPIFPAGGDQPAVNPGSDTYPLDISAALSADRKTLTIAVLNPSDAKQTLNLKVTGTALAKQGQLWQLAPTSINAINIVGKKPEVEIQSTNHVEIPETVEVAPFSVNIYSLPVKQ